MKTLVLLGALAVSLQACAPEGSPVAAPPLPMPPTAPPRAPELVKPSQLPDAEAEHLFRLVLRREREGYVSGFSALRCGTLGPWLGEDYRRNAHARLFARAYPATCQRLVLEILEDEEAPSPHVEFALKVVSFLEEWASPRLDAGLLRLIDKAEYGYPAYFPLWLLARRDPELRHLKLYQEQCARGNDAAFEVLARVDHPSSIPFLEDLRRREQPSYSPFGRIPEEAEDTIRRLKILRSKEWRGVVERIIRVPADNSMDYDVYKDFHWALGVARARALPTLLACLEERARRATPQGDWRDTRDIALAEIAELGGRLEPADFKRFRQNGFVGSPEERLLEILKEERLR